MRPEPLRIALLGGMAAQSADLLRTRVRQPVSVRSALSFDGPGTLEIVADADVVVSPRFPAALGPVSSGLRLVHSTGAGVELIDRSAIPEGVPVCHCHGHARAMAEYALASMIALQRDLAAADRALRRGAWDYGASFGAPRGGELANSRILVLGGGESTRELVLLAAGLGMNVTVLTRTPGRKREGEAQARFEPLTALREHLPATDYLVVSLPLTNETDNLINREALALLPPTAILVNMARSRVVDEAALFDALANGRLRGAAIDVWSRRPSSVSQVLAPSEHPFAELDNVLITPHLAGWSTETQKNRWAEIGANIDRLAEGHALVGVVGHGTRQLTGRGEGLRDRQS